jgi:membrane-associated phospholipid phosphatase
MSGVRLQRSVARGRVLHVNESHLQRAHDFFERHGGKTVFIGRFIALLRTWVAVLAGTAHMRYGSFLLYNALGGILWAVLYGVLGYTFGRNLPRLEHSIGQASLSVVLLVTLIVLVALAMHWFHANASAIAGRTTEAWRRVSESRRFTAFRERHPRAWRFLVVRFARGEYLGLHLTVGLLVALGALWLFSGITEDVVHHDPLTQLDLAILHWFRAHATHTTDTISNAISLIGSPGTLAALALAVGVVLLVRKHWIALAGWVAAFVGGGFLNVALKNAVQRPRPAGAGAFVHALDGGYSYSFPSGHAMGSVFAYGMLAYLVITFSLHRRAARVSVAVVTATLIVAIGVSRLYLGVHYFSDVVGGYAAGVVWLATCISGVEVARRQPAQHRGS